MKTLRLGETGNSPTKICAYNRCCFTKLFHSLDVRLDLQNEVAMHQME